MIRGRLRALDKSIALSLSKMEPVRSFVDGNNDASIMINEYLIIFIAL
jgi:hypothetical protein